MHKININLHDCNMLYVRAKFYNFLSLRCRDLRGEA